jgi:hypothetical protein
MTQDINIKITNVTRQGGLVCIRVQHPSSGVDKVKVNEWPVLLNAIGASSWADATKNTGFTYTFPFALARGTGFPYCLPMQLEADEAVAVLG